MLFDNLTIRLLGSDDFPADAKQQAAADLTAAASEGALSIPIGDPLPLDRIAEAHDRVDAGTRERVLRDPKDGMQRRDSSQVLVWRVAPTPWKKARLPTIFRYARRSRNFSSSARWR